MRVAQQILSEPPTAVTISVGFDYFKANASRVSASIKAGDHDYHLHIVELHNTGPTTATTLAAFVALCSALLGKPIQQQMVVLGSMNLGGKPSAFNVTNRDLIIALAARYGVPAIYFNRFFAESGGLINYSPDFAEQFRKAPEYIDRILKGAKPADLPVQQPTRYELIINPWTVRKPLEVVGYLRGFLHYLGICHNSYPRRIRKRPCGLGAAPARASISLAG
jgi:ABC transporter substrate binding protein